MLFFFYILLFNAVSNETDNIYDNKSTGNNRLNHVTYVFYEKNTKQEYTLMTQSRRIVAPFTDYLKLAATPRPPSDHP